MQLQSILPGSGAEKRAVEHIVSTLRSIADYVSVVDVPVYAWNWRCTVIADGKELPCVLLPYSPPAKLSVRPGNVVSGDLNGLLEANIEGKFVLINYPGRNEELRLAVYLLSRKNPVAVALVTPRSGLLKADVALGTPGYTYLPTTPPSVPVLCVDLEVAKLISTSYVDVEAESNIARGTARVVVAGVNGNSELEVHITSHHDTIIGGIEMTSTNMLLSMAKQLKGQELPVNVTMISYTAREVGDLDLTEYHYTWGERYLLRVLKGKGVLERVLYAIALGPLQSNGELVVAAHPILSKYVEDLHVPVNYNHFLLESHPYMEMGIPALTLMTPNSLLYRNSTHGLGYNQEKQGVLVKANNVISMLLKNVKPSEDWIRLTWRRILNAVDEQGLELRKEVTRLTDIARFHGVINGLRIITRSAYSLVELACTRPFRVYVHSSLFAGLSRSTLSVLEEITSTCNGEVLVGDGQGYRFLRLMHGFKETFSNLYVEYLVKGLKTVVDNEISKAICMLQIARCIELGEESDRNRQVREI
ncbi:MAG: hypothetical protein QXQ73_05270 [Desulfurococcaceae archaeon]